MKTTCAWCQREGRDAAAGDPTAVPGICDEHSARFFAEVESALEGSRRRASTELPPRAQRRPGAPPPKTLGRVEELLVQNASVDLCDRCVAAELGSSLAEVARAVASLGDREDFLRDEWRCGRCGTRDMVTRARRVTPAPSASRSAA